MMQVNGHFAANLDPLGLWDRGQIPEVLDPALYGFKEEDMDRECAFQFCWDSCLHPIKTVSLRVPHAGSMWAPGACLAS